MMLGMTNGAEKIKKMEKFEKTVDIFPNPTQNGRKSELVRKNKAMKKQVLALIAGVCTAHVLSVSAQTTIWFDGFESYADTAGLSGPYTQMYPEVPMPLDTSKGYLSDQSIHFGTPAANYTERAYFNLPGGPVTGSDVQPLKLEFMIDTDVNIWSTRQWIELRSYADGAYGSGDLQQLFALGFSSSGVATDRINYRIVAGPDAGWGDLTDTYATRATVADPNNEWTKLGMWIKSSTIEFYVDDNLDSTFAIPSGVLYDSVVIGSGLSSAGADVWFDDLTVILVPEPSSLALSVLGGFGLLAMFRRRR